MFPVWLTYGELNFEAHKTLNLGQGTFKSTKKMPSHSKNCAILHNSYYALPLKRNGKDYILFKCALLKIQN